MAFSESKGSAGEKKSGFANARVTPNVKELLKKEMFGALAAGSDNHFEKNRAGPEEVLGVSDHYMMLDSFEKNPARSDTANGIYSWDFMVQGETLDAILGTRYKIETVISMQVGEFTAGFPFPSPSPFTNPPGGVGAANPAYPILTVNGAFPPIVFPTIFEFPATPVPFAGFASIQLKELGDQKFQDRGGGHHIPVMLSQNLPGGIPPVSTVSPLFLGVYATPLSGRDTFNFTDPIKDIHGITIQFKNPDTPLVFYEDVMPDIIADVIDSPFGHILTVLVPWTEDVLFYSFNQASLSGVPPDRNRRVLVKGFRSGDEVVDRYVGSCRGRLLSNEPLAPDPQGYIRYTFNPAIVVTFPLGLVDMPSFTICIATRRVRIPVRFRGIEKRITNYMGPG